MTRTRSPIRARLHDRLAVPVDGDGAFFCRIGSAPYPSRREQLTRPHGPSRSRSESIYRGGGARLSLPKRGLYRRQGRGQVCEFDDPPRLRPVPQSSLAPAVPAARHSEVKRAHRPLLIPARRRRAHVQTVSPPRARPRSLRVGRRRCSGAEPYFDAASP